MFDFYVVIINLSLFLVSDLIILRFMLWLIEGNICVFKFFVIKWFFKYNGEEWRLCLC